jgi:hypothetical protein
VKLRKWSLWGEERARCRGTDSSHSIGGERGVGVGVVGGGRGERDR